MTLVQNYANDREQTREYFQVIYYMQLVRVDTDVTVTWQDGNYT